MPGPQGDYKSKDYFAHDVPRRIRAHNLQSLCIVASAYARLRRAEETLFEAWPGFVAIRIPHFLRVLGYSGLSVIYSYTMGSATLCHSSFMTGILTQLSGKDWRLCLHKRFPAA